MGGQKKTKTKKNHIFENKVWDWKEKKTHIILQTKSWILESSILKKKIQP